MSWISDNKAQAIYIFECIRSLTRLHALCFRQIVSVLSDVFLTNYWDLIEGRNGPLSLTIFNCLCHLWHQKITNLALNVTKAIWTLAIAIWFPQERLGVQYKNTYLFIVPDWSWFYQPLFATTALLPLSCLKGTEIGDTWCPGVQLVQEETAINDGKSQAE